jgi:hypothetical protein
MLVTFSDSSIGLADKNADGTAVRKRFGYNVASFVQTDPRFIPLS